MAKFGHVFISGIVWIVIAAGIGILGSWLTSVSGICCYLGWLLAVVGYGFAGLSLLHLWRMTTFQMRGMRMMRDDPERFAEARRRYEEAMHRKHDEEG
mgnify:CR=1 FL=1